MYIHLVIICERPTFFFEVNMWEKINFILKRPTKNDGENLILTNIKYIFFKIMKKRCTGTDIINTIN